MTLAATRDNVVAGHEAAATQLVQGLSPADRLAFAQVVQATVDEQLRKDQALADLALLLVVLDRFDLLGNSTSRAAVHHRNTVYSEALTRCDQLATALAEVGLYDWRFIVLSLRAEILIQGKDPAHVAAAMTVATEAYSSIAAPGQLATARHAFHLAWVVEGRTEATTSAFLNQLIDALNSR